MSIFRLGLTLTLVLGAGFGCDKKKDPGAGLPPAADWSAPAPTPAEVGAASGAPAGAKPPVGMDPNDPHAGLNLGAPGAAMAMGGEGGGVTELGLAPPDPNRAIDSSKFLKGSITANEATKGLIRQGQVIFIAVKRPGPDGLPTGGAIAVERLEFNGWPLNFHLTEAQAMIAGTDFVGDVVITARADQDGDAISRQPGDVEGLVGGKIPSEGLNLVLDAPIR